MIHLQDTLVSEEMLEKDFVCNLSECKGMCCVEGDYGAPMEPKEVETIHKNLEKIKPYMTREGRRKLQEEGFHEVDPEGDTVTTCINDRDCVFARQESDGVYKCSIERAWEDGELDFQKPLSCHLYPAKISDIADMKAVNYDRWDICDPACELGRSLEVPVYKFLRHALIRAFGEAWYQELDAIAQSFRQSEVKGRGK